MGDYSYFTHQHNFAAWAGARAAQRRFKGATVPRLTKALERTGVVEFLRLPTSPDTSRATFDALHRQWCRSIVSHLANDVSNWSFGGSAKVIAVYLKIMVVIGSDPDTSLAKVAHTPIDRIVLQALAGAREIESPHKHEWARIKWTQLGEAEYYRLIGQLRSCLQAGEPMWHLERYWTAPKE